MIKLFTLSKDKKKILIHIHKQDKKNKIIECDDFHKAILYKIKR